AEIKARELYDGLGHPHLCPVDLFGEGRESQPAVNDYLTSFGYGLEHAIAQAVPGIDIDPHSLGLGPVGREFLHPDREFDHPVAGVYESDNAGSLSDVSDDND